MSEENFNLADTIVHLSYSKSRQFRRLPLLSTSYMPFSVGKQTQERCSEGVQARTRKDGILRARLLRVSNAQFALTHERDEHFVF